jgi:hypothetical protein
VIRPESPERALGSSSPVPLLKYLAEVGDRMALPLGNPSIGKSLAWYPESPLKENDITKLITWEQIEFRAYRERNSLEFQDTIVLVETHGMAIMDMNQCDCQTTEIQRINQCDYLAIGSPIFGNAAENCILLARFSSWRTIGMRNLIMQFDCIHIGLGRSREILYLLHRPQTILVSV